MKDRPTQLYRHYDSEGGLLYVGISLSAVARLSKHSSSSAWGRDIAHITVENFPSEREARIAETLAISAERPVHNKRAPDPTAIRFLRVMGLMPKQDDAAARKRRRIFKMLQTDTIDLLDKVAHLNQNTIWK